MIELPMVFMAGILGTAHCVGMCGPLALMVGGSGAGWLGQLGRQSAYTAGRVFTYAVLGATAGFCGSQLVQSLPTLVNVPAVLALVAGSLLVYQGLKAAGFIRVKGIGGTHGPCLSGGLLSQFLRQPGMSSVFLAGVFTGFLPCGLLYGMLAVAMSTHSAAWGAVVLIVFGLGTAPAMMLVGLSSRLVGLATRKRLFAAAAWCLVVAGVVSIARGVSFISIGSKQAGSCPLCRP